MDPDIVTITLNPAIDQTVFLERFTPGTVNRARLRTVQAGGKGVNVSAMLGSYGIPSKATGFAGKANASVFSALFRERGVEDAFLRIDGETRVGIKIVDDSTRATTDINFPGLEPTLADQARFERKLRLLVKPGRWFVLAGSLPAGVSVDFFEELLALMKRGGAKVAVDTSGEALRVAIEGGVDIVKPNEHELAEILGHELPDFPSRVAAAIELQKTKVPHVILSLGSEGALFITPEQSLMAAAPPVKVVSTVGAGDSLLAGYLAGLVTGLKPADRARLATVFAWCALEDVRRVLPSAAEVRKRMPRITVQSLSKMNA
ncbi:1-phosphofructokinase [Luteolibacter sp. LG18]|uniref:1-phosphofructokinase n=1 Tax=Luteolibacter sp. LG18 TaxID=2819286 RepID=UPI002B307A51|nr:1-phosphofructokinase [Luteolibacter sp. LG18]